MFKSLLLALFCITSLVNAITWNKAPVKLTGNISFSTYDYWFTTSEWNSVSYSAWAYVSEDSSSYPSYFNSFCFDGSFDLTANFSYLSTGVNSDPFKVVTSVFFPVFQWRTSDTAGYHMIANSHPRIGNNWPNGSVTLLGIDYSKGKVLANFSVSPVQPFFNAMLSFFSRATNSIYIIRSDSLSYSIINLSTQSLSPPSPSLPIDPIWLAAAHPSKPLAFVVSQPLSDELPLTLSLVDLKSWNIITSVSLQVTASGPTPHISVSETSISILVRENSGDTTLVALSLDLSSISVVNFWPASNKTQVFPEILVNNGTFSYVYGFFGSSEVESPFGILRIPHSVKGKFYIFFTKFIPNSILVNGSSLIYSGSDSDVDLKAVDEILRFDWSKVPAESHSFDSPALPVDLISESSNSVASEFSTKGYIWAIVDTGEGWNGFIKTDPLTGEVLGQCDTKEKWPNQNLVSSPFSYLASTNEAIIMPQSSNILGFVNLETCKIRTFTIKGCGPKDQFCFPVGPIVVGTRVFVLYDSGNDTPEYIHEIDPQSGKILGSHLTDCTQKFDCPSQPLFLTASAVENNVIFTSGLFCDSYAHECQVYQFNWNYGVLSRVGRDLVMVYPEQINQWMSFWEYEPSLFLSLGFGEGRCNVELSLYNVTTTEVKWRRTVQGCIYKYVWDASYSNMFAAYDRIGKVIYFHLDHEIGTEYSQIVAVDAGSGVILSNILTKVTFVNSFATWVPAS